MALFFSSDDPQKLLATFKEKISQGHVETWTVDSDGDFTHNPPQWSRRAWMRPSIEEGRLAFYIWPRNGDWISRAVYAVYHGRLAESMLVHCDKLFSRAEATALAAGKDKVKSATHVSSGS